MSISSVAPGPGAFDPLRDIRALAARNPAPPATPGQAAAQAQSLRKAEVDKDAAQARANPMFQAQDARKTQARARLQQLRDWLKIVAKLYAQNPTGMARALAQAFKDLKAAVKEYADAGGKELGMADAATEAVLAPPADPSAKDGAKAGKDADPARADADTGADAKDDAGQGAQSDVAPEAEATDAVPRQDDAPAKDGASAQAQDAEQAARQASDPAKAPEPAPSTASTQVLAPTSGQAASAQAPAAGAALYGAVNAELRKGLGEDGLEFLGEVRGMLREIGRLYSAARIQAAAHRPDKAAREAFEDADKALKDLNQEMDRSEHDIRQAAPEAGMKLSMTG